MRCVSLCSFVVLLGLCNCTIGQEENSTWSSRDASAQFNLGLMYANGEGVPQDDAEAVKWYLKAAEQGNVKAQFNLGLMYDDGYGVAEDDVEAYAWFSVAGAGGDKDARKNRDIIKRDLTPTQLERGQALAKEIFERIEKRKAAKAE